MRFVDLTGGLSPLLDERNASRMGLSLSTDIEWNRLEITQRSIDQASLGLISHSFKTVQALSTVKAVWAGY